MSDFDQLDKWIDKNAPGLNKKVLHTQVASIADEGSGGGGESLKYGEVEIQVGSTWPNPNISVPSITDGELKYVEIPRGSSGKAVFPIMAISEEEALVSGMVSLEAAFNAGMEATSEDGSAEIAPVTISNVNMAILYFQGMYKEGIIITLS